MGTAKKVTLTLPIYLYIYKKRDNSLSYDFDLYLPMKMTQILYLKSINLYHIIIFEIREKT